MNFLPDNYEAPRTSNYYLKLNEGENRIRILSQPILGWEDWHDKKPVRYTFDSKPNKSFDPKKPVKHFWAFIVFNYNEEQIQVMHVTQATIRKSIEALCRDKDWGAPYFYDIKIMKTGEGVDTEYAVNPVPHKPIDQYLINCFNERRCNLDAIFTNADPFSHEWNTFTPLATNPEAKVSFDQPELGVKVKDISDLKNLFEKCDPVYKEQLLSTLGKLPQPVKKIEDVPLALFDKVRDAVRKKSEEYQAMLSQTEELFAVV